MEFLKYTLKLQMYIMCFFGEEAILGCLVEEGFTFVFGFLFLLIH